MKVIIAGPRDYNDYVSLLVAIHLAPFDINEVVSGRAKGVDSLGERWARDHGIPVKPFPADWKRWGNGAGPKRNKEMADHSEGCLLLWDGMSRGTRSMKMIAEAQGLELFVYGIRGYRPRPGRRYAHLCGPSVML